MSRFFSEKFDNLVPYTPGEQPQDTGRVIKLNTNENPFPPSPNVYKALTEPVISKLSLYSDPYCTQLHKALAEDIGVDVRNIYTGNGSDEVLAFCFYAFSDKGIAFPDMTYGFYSVFASLFGLQTIQVPLREDFRVDVSDYEKLSCNVIIANPNSPSGLALTPEEIEELINQDRNRLVIIDEAYVDFGAKTAVGLISKYDNLLVIRTFSKSRSLAGGRLGVAVGCEELISDLNTIKFSINPYNVNRLTQAAGKAAIEDKEYFEYTRNEIIKSREYTKEQLKNLGFKVFDSMSNFVFAGKHDKLAGDEYFAKLRQRNIIVRYFDTPREKDYVRISIGSLCDMEAFIKATKNILEEVCDA